MAKDLKVYIIVISSNLEVLVICFKEGRSVKNALFVFDKVILAFQENNDTIFMYFCTRQPQGKMPEWSNGPHSKCGERVTAPWVRIPVFPLDNYNLFTQNTK